MKVLLLTNEYPPHIYGGAGVHIEALSRKLAALMDVEVRCFGEQDWRKERLRVKGFEADKKNRACPENLHPVFAAVQRSLDFNTGGIDAAVAHCHTWYTHMGGILAKLNYGIPLVITAHSLEPLRPWKREQLGRGYDFSLWVEKTAIEIADAVTAVSAKMKEDIQRLFRIAPERVRVIPNGVDVKEFHRREGTEALRRRGVDPDRPYILFVGRITRQKGIIYLVKAIAHLDPGFQVVLCAGQPDTPEIEREMRSAVAEASARRDGVIWIQEMLDKESMMEFYSHAAVFCCPSIYEPFGIINLEAMACVTPVVASAVGGIPEVVADGETGLLVPVEEITEPPFSPSDPEQFARDLAAAVNRLMADEAMRKRFGEAGRRRVEERFSWTSVARRTKELYEELARE